ncbi:antitermination protein [Raoultella planticola]|uniref:Antitermination protein n=2 Tax=Raoultella planticola TaxID=575 RepID=A0A8G2A1N6_RAOPL|nr:antitermination protein [Raoultella planticola]MDU4422048.1 antitermination protein [Raoultella sp.]MDV1190447.1 antitermination protein [Raoultella planticola]MDV1451010.1 antitermination protein [Raoultella planticola]MDV1566740.1 antitermination protein [Raoultella planticola]MDV1572298.1 antitermination protein [Raoultella planticola]
MKLEALPKFFSPKSMMPGAVPCGITAETLTITDVMAALGLATSKSAIGIELYLAKAGVLHTDNILAFIYELATQRASRNRPLQAMPEQQREAFLLILAQYVFRDYSLSAASRVTCSSCAGDGFIDAEVFTNKVTYPDGKPPKWVKVTKGISPSDWEEVKTIREQVRVICKACNGKGSTKNECRCRGRGEVLDKKKSELQGLPVFKQCPRCSGRGYPRLKDTEIFKALGVTETTWRRNFKLFFDRLVEYCHIEESFAEKMLERVTR